MSDTYLIKQCGCKRSTVTSAYIDGRLFRKTCSKCGKPWRLNIHSRTPKQGKRKSEPVN